MSQAAERPRPQDGGGRQSRRSARTRERILDAATFVFARRGFHGTRVADIADHAGIAYGLVYHHFHNKEEILAAIYAEQWGTYVRYLEELRSTPLSFPEKMAKLVHFWVTIYRQEPHLMTVMMNEITRSYEFLDSHDIGTVLVAFDAIQGMVEEAQQNGELRPGIDAQLATYMIVGVAEMILTGYVLGTLQRRDESDYVRDEEQIIELLLRGMCRERETPE
jgi:TetR/AcrR family fatty acid metabolism transcriptional regulator